VSTAAEVDEIKNNPVPTGPGLSNCDEPAPTEATNKFAGQFRRDPHCRKTLIDYDGDATTGRSFLFRR
jgi:hypothetical protein